MVRDSSVNSATPATGRLSFGWKPTPTRLPVPRVSATAAVEAPKVGGRPILCEFSDENVRVRLDSLFSFRV
jgi:hypothetical protein